MLTFNQRAMQRQLHRQLYPLQRAFGVAADIYVVTVSGINVETGKSTTSKTKIHVPRLVTLETKYVNRLEAVLTKDIKFGGEFQVGDKVAVVATRTTGEIEFNDKTYFVIGGARFSIVSTVELEAKAGYIVHLRRTNDQNPSQIFEKVVLSFMNITQEVGYE